MSITPLSLAKQMLQIQHATEDALVQALLDGAEDYLQQRLECVFGTDDYTENLPLSSKMTDFRNLSAFNRPAGDDYLIPTKRPVNSVATVLDLQNASAAMTFVKIRNLIAWATGGIRYGAWPQGEQRYAVTYNGGIALVADRLPGGLQMIVLMLVSRVFSARGGETHQEGAGVIADFGVLWDSDLEKMASQYSQKRVCTL